MATALLRSFVESIANVLEGSLAVPYIKYVFSLKSELQTFTNTLSAIKAALEDMEKQQEMSRSDRDWLEKLHDVLYDADDLATEALQKQLFTPSNLVEQVPHFFSTMSSYVVMAYKLKETVGRVEDITADRNRFCPVAVRQVVGLQSRNIERQQTHSFVLEPDVIGRDGDKKEIIKLIMDNSIQENVSVIPIVGIGGVGKTALAQLVYNDEQVKRHFELKTWACVSDIFNVKVIVEKIIESATCKKCENFEMERLQTLLRKEIGGKRFLLILDDVWNDEHERWLELRNLLMGGAKGSKIIITTRMDLVATITSTVTPYILKGLPEDMSWSLFRHVAFKGRQELEDPRLVAIGKEIVRKCAGVPLVIRTLGSLLYYKDTEIEWLSFKHNELSKIAQNENVILQILKLSYDQLPPHLKRCYAYCSLFPKDFVFDKHTSINLWIAQGFFLSSSKNQCLEDVGHEYFMDLLRRSLFQDVRKDELGIIISYKIHDLFHDLAQSVAGIEISLANLDAENVVERTRHVSFSSPLDSSWKILTRLLHVNKIRSFLLPVESKGATGMSFSTCDTIFSRFRCLRVLDLHELGMETVPSSLGELRHLRFLDLSGNNFVMLPEAITRLLNLQTLKLPGCYELKEFPRDIRKLVSLRLLQLGGCSGLTHMPRGLGQLTSLQTLTRFVVGQDSSICGGLSELNGLINLQGELRIEGLGRGFEGMTTAEAAEEANNSYLKEKESLQSLTLYWDSHHRHHAAAADLLLLEGLQPHPNLKKMALYWYGGVSFPSWMMVNIGLSLPYIVRITVWGCNRCQQLPPFGQLPSLQVLILGYLNSVEYIDNGSDDGHSSLEGARAVESSATLFPSLIELGIFNMPKLKGWWRGEELIPTSISTATEPQRTLTSLEQWKIYDCPRLMSLPREGLISLQFLIIRNCENLTSLSQGPQQSLTSLKQLEIHHCSTLMSLLMEGLISLRFLTVQNCEKLTSLSRGMQYLTALEKLDINNCPELDLSDDDGGMELQAFGNLTCLSLRCIPRLVSLPVGLRHVTTLESLTIESCDDFTTLPEWIGNLTSLQELRISYCPNLASLPCNLTLPQRLSFYALGRNNGIPSSR